MGSYHIGRVFCLSTNNEATVTRLPLLSKWLVQHGLSTVGISNQHAFEKTKLPSSNFKLNTKSLKL